MFSYYGSKSKIVKHYPRPIYNKIIEPFAGSARYSLMYFDRDVLLVDKYPVIVDVWHYLQKASPKDILSLPNIEYKQKIPKYLSSEEKALIGYCVARGVPRPCTMGHKFNNWSNDKIRIAESLYKIKHWTIKLGDYKEIENEKATWFIDPPYIKAGYKYSHSKINYNNLSIYCKERIGQVIVCEGDSANWLEFKPLLNFSGAFKKSTEYMWTNCSDKLF